MPANEQKKKAVEQFLEILEKEKQKKNIYAFLYDENAAEFKEGFITEPMREAHWVLGYGKNRTLEAAIKQLVDEKEAGQVLENVILILSVDGNYNDEGFASFQKFMEIIEHNKLYLCLNIVNNIEMMKKILEARSKYNLLGLVDISFATEMKYAVGSMVRMAINQRHADRDEETSGIRKSAGIQKSSAVVKRGNFRGNARGGNRGGYKRKWQGPSDFSRKNRKFY